MLVADYASMDQNHPPDFVSFRKFGGRAVIVRGAFTFNGHAHVDPCVTHRNAIVEAGLQFGCYLIHGWRVDPLEQVRAMFEAYPARLPGDLPPWLDVEFPGNGIHDFGLSPAAALARLEVTLDALEQRYGTVGVYTSARVWREDLAGISSTKLGRCPLWIKVPYPYKARTAPHIDVRGRIDELPAPWRAPSSPGAFLKQFQGDAIGVPGFSSTVDLSEWLTYRPNYGDPRDAWVSICTGGKSIADFQKANGLVPDSTVGPATFAALC